MTVRVVAFDGLLAETLDLRADAIMAAAAVSTMGLKRIAPASSRTSRRDRIKRSPRSRRSAKR